MRFVAEDVAGKVHGALSKCAFKRDVSLSAVYREVEIGTRRPDEKERKWAEETIAKPSAEKQGLPYIYAQRTLRLAEHPETTTIPLQVLRIGDVCLGTMPCEVFCEIGFDFKRRSPMKPALLVSLAHGYYGYLPTPRHLDLGGYETWLGTNRLERNASGKMLDQLLEMAEELKP
jgi:neutral ceramidase